MSQCSVYGCSGKHNARGFCMKHYCQMKRFGKILPRSLKDKNEMVIDGDICRIKLYALSGEVKAETIIDAEDHAKVKNHKWALQSNGYVTAKNKGKSIYLSALVLGVNATIRSVVDHMDGDTLNNRKGNLRHCTTQQNFFNQCIRSNNTSGFKGVFWDKRLKKWRARIKINYVGKHLGCFPTKEEAAVAYNQAAIENYGEFARLNIMDMEG